MYGFAGDPANQAGCLPARRENARQPDGNACRAAPCATLPADCRNSPVPARYVLPVSPCCFQGPGPRSPAGGTGRPGPVRVSPVLLPGAECKPQVARCPALHEEPASGASCEAATDADIRIARGVLQIAGEKARQTRITPLRAEVRLASQKMGPGPRLPVGATGRPGPVRVSPVLLPGAERKSQVTRCPVLHEEPASGVNCEAATDVDIGVGRRLFHVAGEKARQTRIIPRRAEVRLAPQIRKGYSVFVFDCLRRHRHKVPPF